MAPFWKQLVSLPPVRWERPWMDIYRDWEAKWTFSVSSPLIRLTLCLPHVQTEVLMGVLAAWLSWVFPVYTNSSFYTKYLTGVVKWITDQIQCRQPKLLVYSLLSSKNADWQLQIPQTPMKNKMVGNGCHQSGSGYLYSEKRARGGLFLSFSPLFNGLHIL